MRFIQLSLSFVLAFAIVGCNRKSEIRAPGKSTQATPSVTHPVGISRPVSILGDAQRKDFIAYIEGQAISLPDGEEHVVQKEEITAVQFGSSSSFVSSGPNEQDVTFLMNAGRETYAVHGSVTFRGVEETVAFFGFVTTSVEKQ